MKTVNIIEVVPIIKNAPSGSLSYFSGRAIKKGALVSVEANKKTIEAVVLFSRSAAEKKSFLRKSDFSLKPVKSVKMERFLSEEFLEAAKKISNYFALPLGSALFSLMDKIILTDFCQIMFGLTRCAKAASDKNKTIFIEEEKELRIKFYIRAARDYLKNNRSVFICAPGKTEVVFMNSKFNKSGIKNIFCFFSGMPKKDFLGNIKKIKSLRSPYLILASPKFFPLINANFGALILENFESYGYKMKRMPYLDFKKCAEILAKEFKIQFIIGGRFLNVDNYFKKGKGELISLKNSFPDSKNNENKPIKFIKREKGDFSVLSREAKEILLKGGKSIIFINRRGYNNFALCFDCKKILECQECSAPLKIHILKERRVFICRYCLKKSEIKNTCPNCGGFNMGAFGVGIEKVEEEIRREFKELPIFKLDSDSVKNKKNAANAARDFRNSENGILVATEMAIPYLNFKVGNVIVLAADGMLNIPDYKINEKLFFLIQKLKELPENDFAAETRAENSAILNKILTNNISGFYNEEILARKKFFYPPFSVLIKISKEDKNKEKLLSETSELKERLSHMFKGDENKENLILVFPSFIEKIKGKYRMNILLKIKTDEWPDKHMELGDFLKCIPRCFKIEVNPESLL